MSQALYRKYRSRSFDEIVGQNTVVKALSNAIDSNNIGHAYLFTGPRGVGKTSIARIFAYAINKVPYDSEELPVDIIEIDAASNRGIDEVRDPREKVRIAPVVGPYKIYIIDEVHMLTSHAFNALLKTLEEPPAHVVFILATTEGHRLPETITSRTQRYTFKLASKKEVSDYLKEISINESIDITDEAIDIIAQHSGGSLRDALSMLDHARHLNTKITANDILDTSGLPDEELVNSIFNDIDQGDITELISNLELIDERSISPNIVASVLSKKITTNLQNNNINLSTYDAAQLLSDLSEVESSSLPMSKLQIALIKCCSNINTNDAKKVVTVVKNDKNIKKTIPTNIVKPQAIKSETLKTSTEHIKTVTKEINPKDSENLSNITKEIWDKVLEDIRATHNTLYSVLRMAELDITNLSKSSITLIFSFPFHLKRINEAKNKVVVQQKLAELGYESVEINCELNSESQEKKPKTSKANSVDNSSSEAMMNKIRGVFGAAEVLE